MLKGLGFKGSALSAAVASVFCVESPWSCQGLVGLRTRVLRGLRSIGCQGFGVLRVRPGLLPQMCPSSDPNRHGPARFGGLRSRVFGGLRRKKVLTGLGFNGSALSAAVASVFCVESPSSCQGLVGLRTRVLRGLRSIGC